MGYCNTPTRYLFKDREKVAYNYDLLRTRVCGITQNSVRGAKMSTQVNIVD